MRRAESMANRAKTPRAPREHTALRAASKAAGPHRGPAGSREQRGRSRGRASMGRGGPEGAATPHRASESGPPCRGGGARRGRGREAGAGAELGTPWPRAMAGRARRRAGREGGSRGGRKRGRAHRGRALGGTGRARRAGATEAGSRHGRGKLRGGSAPWPR
jgi:hypothetical protein